MQDTCHIAASERPGGTGGGELPILPAPWNLAALTALSRRLPPVRGAGSIALHGIRRLYRGKGPRVLPIWPGVRMAVDPFDSIGGLLAFVPHLYDRSERKAMQDILRPGDIFVDVGSNIGTYALWAARLVGPAGRVVAIEADPANYRLLSGNILRNGFGDRVRALHCGISDRREALRLYRNVTGNCGGHNFSGTGEEGPTVTCLPLDEALREQALPVIRMMKLDIEGFEPRVLQRYFASTSSSSRPAYLLVEIDGGPLGRDPKQSLRSLILSNGYSMVIDGANSLFRRDGGQN
jgi:FkbM family methyltransferase